MFDLTAAQAVLKEDYLGPVREQLNNDNYVIKKLVENKQEATGKEFWVPLHYGRNNGIGYRGEGAALPTAGSQKYKQSLASTKYLYGGIEITGPTIKAMRNDKGAFIRAVDSEMKGLLKDLKDQRARALFGDGTGKLATFPVNTGLNTLLVDKAKYFQVGMVIDILSSTGTPVAPGKEITAVNKSDTAPSITVNGGVVTTAAGNIAVLAGDYNIEAMGLGGIMSQTLPLQAIDPATNTWWKSNTNISTGVSGALKQSDMRLSIDDAELEGGKIDLITTSYGVRASLESNLQNNVRFVQPMTLEGGYKVLDYDGMPIVVDRYHESKLMYFLDSSELDLYQLSDFEWMMDDKGAALAPVPGFDKYAAMMYCYETLVTYKRNAHSSLTGITEAAGYNV